MESVGDGPVKEPPSLTRQLSLLRASLEALQVHTVFRGQDITSQLSSV